jgi:hypothetical protein
MTLPRLLATAAAVLALSVPAAFDEASAQQQAQGSTTVPAGALSTSRLGPNQFLAGKMIGMHLFEPGNRKLGEIEDLVIERDGRVSAAIVSVGGALGIGEKHVAIPLSQLSVDNDRALTSQTREQLAQAPRFDYDRRRDRREVGSGGTGAPIPVPGLPSSPSR